MASAKQLAAQQTHKGAPRLYWCTHDLVDGKLPKHVVQQLAPNGNLHDRVMSVDPKCQPMLVHEGEKQPFCSTHGILMVKKKNRTHGERRMEVDYKAKVVIDFTSIWIDEAPRKSRCHLCREQIKKGDKRMAFSRLIRQLHEVFAGERRCYIHETCFYDLLYGGKARQGCQGCSAKIMDAEFRSYKAMIKKQIDA